jgi:G3E family GTPase
MQTTKKTYPITLITGFLGSGKTTFINKIISDNPNKKFALLINEFGEVGIDGKIIQSELEDNTQQTRIVEISNGCLCCIVRGDLIDAVAKLVATNEVDHILIEASGLAEPQTIAQTFAVPNEQVSVSLDCIVCLVDCLNFENNIEKYKVLKEQLKVSDVVILNKFDNKKVEFNQNIYSLVSNNNPHCTILENAQSFNTKILFEDYIDNHTFSHLLKDDNHKGDHHNHHGHDHHEHEHHHEHEDFTELVFSTKKLLDPQLLDQIFLKELPKSIIRAKGFITLKTELETKTFLFQMVGAHKTLTPYKDTLLDETFIVLIGKNFDKEQVLSSLQACQI